jgi:hypothetical protein
LSIKNLKIFKSLVWWQTPVIPALWRLEDCKFQASMGYSVSSRPIWATIRKTLSENIPRPKKKKMETNKQKPTQLKIFKRIN